MLDPTKKRYIKTDTHIQGQMEAPSKIVDGAKSHLEWNPITAKDAGRAQTKPCMHRTQRPHRDWARPMFVSPAEVCISSGLLQGQGLWVQLAGPCNLWHKPSWRRLPLTHHRVTEQTTHKLQNNYTKEILVLLRNFQNPQQISQPGIWQRDWQPPDNLTLEASGIWLQNLDRTGETDSWRAQIKPCVHQDPGERSSDPTRDWPRCAYECRGVSSRGVGQRWLAAGSGALSVAMLAHDLLKEVALIFITSTIVWSQVKQQGGNTAPPINRKLD